MESLVLSRRPAVMRQRPSLDLSAYKVKVVAPRVENCAVYTQIIPWG